MMTVSHDSIVIQICRSAIAAGTPTHGSLLGSYPHVLMCRSGCSNPSKQEAACPDWNAWRTALDSRCCGCRRPHRLRRGTTRQNDGHRQRGRSAERHVRCARDLLPRSALAGMRYAVSLIRDTLFLERCSGGGMSEEGWYSDPYRVHEHRWFSNGTPTDLVRDQGSTSQDAPPEIAHIEQPRLVEAPQSCAVAGPARQAQTDSRRISLRITI